MFGFIEGGWIFIFVFEFISLLRYMLRRFWKIIWFICERVRVEKVNVYKGSFDFIDF